MGLLHIYKYYYYNSDQKDIGEFNIWFIRRVEEALKV